jgi:hypothetical protein
MVIDTTCDGGHLLLMLLLLLLLPVLSAMVAMREFLAFCHWSNCNHFHPYKTAVLVKRKL